MIGHSPRHFSAPDGLQGCWGISEVRAVCESGQRTKSEQKQQHSPHDCASAKSSNADRSLSLVHESRAAACGLVRCTPPLALSPRLEVLAPLSRVVVPKHCVLNRGIPLMGLVCVFLVVRVCESVCVRVCVCGVVCVCVCDVVLACLCVCRSCVWMVCVWFVCGVCVVWCVGVCVHVSFVYVCWLISDQRSWVRHYVCVCCVCLFHVERIQVHSLIVGPCL